MKTELLFKEALETSGYMGEEANRFNSNGYRAFLELHIEQGPVLESENKDIGVVEGVLGMVNCESKTRGGRLTMPELLPY